ncbi:MAG: hypothetical protein Q8K79_07395 [Solirubrobacteraceae bacterium]|nr:hypothetical protein [Solirubrobacteraceae bacterium]
MRAGAGHLVQRALPVAGLDVDGGDRVDEHGDVEARAQRVEHRRLHAVVRGEAADEDAGDPGLAQQRRQPGGVEAGVGVGAERRGLVEQRPGQRRDVGVQLGAVGPGHAVRRPRPALLGE